MNQGAGVRKGARLFLFLLLAVPARAGELWLDHEWLRLLHVKDGATDARPGAFFLSRKGDPREEFEALMAVLEDDSPDPLPSKAEFAKPEPTRCRFPARAVWLAGRLGLDPAKVLAPCRRFSAWRDLLAADGVALVFASAYMNNPSSMFGHTFLRLERAGPDRLLDNSLNFAAETSETSGVAFAIRGLTGLYAGKYTAMPYYLKVHEYGSIENRDLWEYRLNLSNAEVARLAAHAWELGQAEFSYYFLSRNCSYQLMPALEAAAPRLNLFGTPSIVGPMDTVLAVAATPGLVHETVFRPSHATTLRQRRALLSSEERRAAWAYAAGRAEEGDARSSTFAPARKALILEAAHDLILYRYGFNPEVAPKVRALEHPLLLRRGRLETEVPTPARPSWALPPHEAHRRQRLTVGAGARRGGGFAEASWRAGLHALEDAAPAYLPGNAIEAFSGRVRYDGPTERPYVRDLRVLDIVSLTPFDSWTRKPSWALGTGLDTAYAAGRGPADSLVYDGRLATGLAWGRPEGGPVVLGLLAGGDFAVGPVLRDGGRLGGLLCLLGAWDAGSLRAAVRASLGGSVAGDPRPDHRFAASFDWRLGRDRSLRASYFMNGPHREAMLNAVVYH